MQRIGGEVTAVNGATITLKANDGTTWQIVTTDNTHILRRAPGAEGADGGAGARFGTPSKLADIHPGDGAMGLGMEDAPTHTLHAFAVVSTSAADLQALRANLGKTYITGRVVSVDLDNATMSLTRPDGVTQTIGFDENTSFRRGHGHREQGTAEGGDAAAAAPADESITLADIHPGDNVYGKGAVKNGMFIPAELTVMSPRRPRGGPAMRDLPPQQQ